MNVLLRPSLLVLSLLAAVPAAAQNLVSTGSSSGLRLFMTNGNDFWLDPTNGALVFKVNGNAVSTMTPEGFWLVNGMSAIANTGMTVSSLTTTITGASQYSIRSSSGMNLLAGGINLNSGGGGFIRFPDGTSMITAPAGGSETNTYASTKTFTTAVAVGVIGASDGALVVRSTSTTPANPAVSVRANAGGELLRVQEDGRVGIGTGSGAGTAARLHVSSAAAAATDTVFLVSSGTSTGQELLIVKGDGKVGIGGYVPNAALDVYRRGDVAAVYMQGQGDAWNYSGFNLWSDEATDKYWALYHRKAAGEANNLLLEEFDGSAYKQRLVMKPDGTASFGNSTTKTQFELQGAGDSFNYTSFIFYNHDWTRYWAWMHRKGAGEVNSFFLEEFNGTGYSVRMTFKPGGDVGLGTTDPVARLHVSSAGATSSQSVLLVSSGAAAGQELLVVKGDGRVGVGTANPGARLGVTQADTTGMGVRVEMPTAAENTWPGIRVKGYSPSIELMDKDNVQNWYMGIDDNDSNKLLIGRGYGPGQGVAQAVTIDAADNVGIGVASPVGRLNVVNASVQPGLFVQQNADHQGIMVSNTSAINYPMSLESSNESFTGNVLVLSSWRPASAAYNMLVAYSDINGTPDLEFRLTGDGNVTADGTFTSPADYAEFFRSDDATLTPGELICVAGAGKVARCAPGGTLIGVVSTKPGVVGVYAEDVTDAVEAYEKDPRWVKVALMGQVPVKVSVSEGGKVKAGDQLTAGPGGAAVKGASPRTLLLLALDDLDADGKVRALVK